MNRINYQGLDIKTDSKYLYIHEGEQTFFRDKESVFEISFKSGETNKNISSLFGISMFGREQVLRGMKRPELFTHTTLTLNGLKFWKSTYDQHIVKIVIVGDSETRVLQTYEYTTIIINKDNVEDKSLIEHIFYSGGLKYIIPETPKACISDWEWRNFQKIVVNKKSLDITSDSGTIYYLRNKYDDYRIRSIDYQNQFIEELRKILGEYGIELVRFNREKTLSNPSYVSYRFSQTPSSELHPGIREENNEIMSRKVGVEFELRCDNTQLFFDFKNKYTNVNLLTNFVEMSTMDKYGDLWVSAIKWGRVTEDFSQMYDQDSNQNFSLSCQFSAELHFYEVFDNSSEFIKEISLELSTEGVE